jgi:hypothetical protein
MPPATTLSPPKARYSCIPHSRPSYLPRQHCHTPVAIPWQALRHATGTSQVGGQQNLPVRAIVGANAQGCISAGQSANLVSRPVRAPLC